MFFKRLELIGFKSFMNKTTLHFEPGITAVVGPNGTGKSNIFDAIRWVLGEQSVKALRGSEMQDVIFNGTDLKEGLSMAEVSLTFDNTNRFFNVDHDEVAITRRIFRSGESEYLLNKLEVRLKDILNLLMGTGVALESYSLVAQGQIDLILSSRSEDRRLVFDEASGITKYKAQKKEAMRKLEETEQNLLRVNDIIVEVKRQIGSLERQATKARRYKEIFEELKSKEISLAILQKKQLYRQKNEIINNLSELELQESRLLNIIKDAESKISIRNLELKTFQDNIMAIKNQILNLDNLVTRNKEHVSFNDERIKELETTKKYLEAQIKQTRNRLILDEEKLNKVRQEYNGIKKDIEDKSRILKDTESQLNSFTSSIKMSLENIALSKKEILELVTKTAHVNNEIVDLSTKQQIYLARLRRLETEKAKVNEEKNTAGDNLKNVTQEIENLNKIIEDLNLKIGNIKNELDREGASLTDIKEDIESLEKQRLTLESHKEFIERLKSKYQDLGESMNAVIYLDKLPAEKVSGLVIRIKEYINLSDEDKAYFEGVFFKLSGEAKSIDLDTQKINEKIKSIQESIYTLKNTKITKEVQIEELNKSVQNIQQDLRGQEMVLVNKRTFHQTILEQFNKMKEEEDIIVIELSDVHKELSILEEKVKQLQSYLSELNKQQKEKEDLISNEQDNIALKSNLKEEALVTIAQIKTGQDALAKRIDSDAATLKILEDIYQQDKEGFANFQRQIKEAEEKQVSLDLEIKDLENKINEAACLIQSQNIQLKETEDKYKEIANESSAVTTRIEENRREIDSLKKKLYELQMQNKDVDFKYLSIKERILQAYQIDLDNVDRACEINENIASEDIQRLKEKLNSLGTVNLVAIEEYDELKKRYDFLTQQQNDLICAKESLHEAILKINRTTKKMFLETFEKVRQEFRNYFRLLFNGGDAQIFLIDEQDPLESGIEIICRPPGKKLQNVLLLSGGEKSLAAIALIFAIFKVKPSPFCVLDEIDAALDEANIDRFARLLQEFTKSSQFIVITHNKKTIANADVMYGITMEQSGVSKIVSVKFAKDKTQQTPQNRESDLAVAEPV